MLTLFKIYPTKTGWRDGLCEDEDQFPFLDEALDEESPPVSVIHVPSPVVSKGPETVRTCRTEPLEEEDEGYGGSESGSESGDPLDGCH